MGFKAYGVGCKAYGDGLRLKGVKWIGCLCAPYVAIVPICLFF